MLQMHSLAAAYTKLLLELNYASLSKQTANHCAVCFRTVQTLCLQQALQIQHISMSCILKGLRFLVITGRLQLPV